MLTTNESKLAYMIETIGERIRKERIAQDLTQQDLADAAGTTRSAIGQIESGITKSPKPDHVYHIARRLNRSLEWLITGKGSKYPMPQGSGFADHNELVELLATELRKDGSGEDLSQRIKRLVKK